MFTLYSADYIGAPSNCSYPHKFEVTDKAAFTQAVSRDYVCAEYMNHYRNGDNFLGSDCLPVDCDNDHSENPEDWVTLEDVKLAFPGITFAVHYSRSHMREKNGKAPRPKFHVLFPIEYMTDAAAYSEMKKLVNAIFPYFDTKALDAARFFFGTANPEVELYPGEMTLSEYLSGEDFDADMVGGSHGGKPDTPAVTIGEGSLVKFKDSATKYNPTSVTIPGWVKKDYNHIVTKTTSGGKAVAKGGKTCVLLGKKVKKSNGKEYAGINTWVAVENLELVTATPAPSYRTHTVIKGDSLWSIAKKYLGDGSRYPEIKKLNNLTSNVIYSGWKLLIPNK